MGRLYERKGDALSLSVKFVTSSDLIAMLKPVKNEKESYPWLIGRDKSPCLFLSWSHRRNEEQSYGKCFFSCYSTYIVQWQMRTRYIIVPILDLFLSLSCFDIVKFALAIMWISIIPVMCNTLYGFLILKFLQLTVLLARWHNSHFPFALRLIPLWLWRWIRAKLGCPNLF